MHRNAGVTYPDMRLWIGLIYGASLASGLVPNPMLTWGELRRLQEAKTTTELNNLIGSPKVAVVHSGHQHTCA